VSESTTSLALVGAGRLGSALAAAAGAARIDVRLAGRDDAVAAAAASELVLLCVPDRAIADAAVRVSAADPMPRLVGHTSGASTLDVLEPASARGAETFSLHPLQTVPDAESSVAGAPCAVAGSSAGAEQAARELALRLGMVPFSVPEEARAAYHAAASMASNLLVALEESAAELLARVGIDDPRELLAPLVLRSATNWTERGSAALTGPIARGDADTVRGHRAAIEAVAPELLASYDALADRARSIAARPRGEG